VKKLIFPVLFLLFGANFGYSQTSDYVRFQRGAKPGDGELQIAVETFTKGGVTVDLYGVVHMADAAYYKSVQRDLNTYHTVLYEGIKQGTTPNSETQGLNFIQKGVARFLGLQFQKDGISYVGSNMVHADVDASTLKRSLKGQKLSPLGGLLKPKTLQQIEPLIKLLGDFLDRYLAANPQIRARFKLQMAKQLSSTDISKQLPANMKKAIIDDRNQIVMNVLAQQLRYPKKKRIAIFYGAGHNPDFSKRLQAIGFRPTSKTWKTAWKIGNGVAKKKLKLKKTPPKKKSKMKAY